eukprot:TRINITY_DN18911_c0_g1_i1.p1 TRINITY_DN18911_c0_g1~~TRINITY_DN18911_c0_g1_i1.p1  ORF type:complete len:362 (+),score=62.64 TRINITY_DN18911_c0_g1_i1:100-1086(+)
MAPKAKKTSSGPKASAKANGAAEASGSKDERWVRARASALAAQREAAVERGDDWVEAPHLWHEDRLAEILRLLESGVVSSLPDEFREGVEFYVSQFADGTDTSEETFYDDREIYTEILQKGVAPEQAPYVRPPETVETEEAIQTLSAWSDTTAFGMGKFCQLVKKHPDSAGVAKAALEQIAALVAKHKDDVGTSAVKGLEPKPMMAFVTNCLERFSRDGAVQVSGCKAVLSLGEHSGKRGWTIVVEAGAATLWVKALRNHVTDQVVVRTVTRAFYVLLRPQVVAMHSPEWATICSSGVEKALLAARDAHLSDNQIGKDCSTTVPFLRG